MVSYIHTSLSKNVMARLHNTPGKDSQYQETFSAPSLDNNRRSYETECQNYHRSVSTVRSKQFICTKMKW